MFPQQKRRKTLLDFNFKKIRNNDCENVKKSIPVDDLACSKNNPQNVIEEPGETPDADKATKDLVLQPSNDISLCIGKTYTQAERLRMLKNIWIPDQSFNFPITATNHRNLRFQHRWFIRFKWLAYSYLENGAFCKYCVLFGSKAGSGVGNQPLGTLCAVKFQKWKNALERFADYESTKYHRDNVVAAETVMSILSGKQDSIEIQLNQQQKQTILENRRKITPIIETIILCGRQGIPLRGHRDSGPLTFLITLL